MASEQSFQNHARWVPPFHFVAGPILLIYFGYTLWMLTKSQVWPNILASLVALALVITFVSLRGMVNRVQDRVIRLEEQVRMERLLPPELKSRIGEFTVNQLIALRFASDAELPGAARAVLEKGISDQKEIKAMITTWRPDHHRA